MASPALKLRPRDGTPHKFIEHVAQALWKWRAKIAITYIVLAVGFAALVQTGLL